MLSRSIALSSKKNINESSNSVKNYIEDSNLEYEKIKWPWINEIEKNGDLMYIENQVSYSLLGEEPDISQSSLFHVSREQSVPQIIKYVIKNTPLFARKALKDEIADRNIKTRRKSIHFHPTFSKIKNNLSVLGTNAFRKDITVTMLPKLTSGFIDLENMFGIISGLEYRQVLNNEITLEDYNGSKDSLRVQGIVPSSQSSFSEDVFVGDVLVAVNGDEVDCNNISKKLTEVNGLPEAKLTFERSMPHGNLLKSVLVSLVSNRFEDSMLLIPDELFAIMVLTLDGDENKPDSDIVYFYPKNRSNESNILLHQIRGMFLTLDDTLVDFIGDSAQSSILKISSKQVNVCYKKMERNLFVAAILNERCSMSRLIKAVEGFTDLLVITNTHFSSLDNKHKHLVVLLLENLFNSCETDVSFGDIHQLQLPVEYYTDIGCVLNDLESSDYGEYVDDFFPHRRLYFFLGTALFYKDNLICNHLSATHLKKVVLLCKFFGLFLLLSKESVNKMIFWKEIFISQDLKDGSFRWFVLAIGQGHSMLVTLLEAGSIASLPSGNPGPHPYYVDATSSILSYIFETMDLESFCELRLNQTPFPSIGKQSNTFTEASRDIESKMKMNTDGEQYSDDTSHLSHSKSLGSFSDISYISHRSTRLTFPAINLFYHITLKRKSAVFISSNICDPFDTLFTDVLLLFQLCSEEIHKCFAERNVIEKGVMFNVLSTKGAAMKKDSPNMIFWVVGRLVKRGIDNDEEIFLCYQDGVPQNTVEMVFNMRFGSYW